jgi:hypothetical protein
MKPPSLAMLAMAVAAVAGSAEAAESTRVYRQGHSTATITQSGGGSKTVTRRIIRGPNSQTIVQSQGGNKMIIRQSAEEDDPEDLESDALDERDDEDWW